MNPSYVSDASHYASPPTTHDHQEQTKWNIEENKLFENAIAEFDHDSPDFFKKIASRVPGKNVEQIQNHYQALIDDIEKIESGLVPLPEYRTSDEPATNNQNRRRGAVWTAEEHKLFLQGLKKYGKGHWKSISRNYVLTRNPTQVASHAQKYFLRLRKQNAGLPSKRKESSTSTSSMAVAPSISPALYAFHNIFRHRHGDECGPSSPTHHFSK